MNECDCFCHTIDCECLDYHVKNNIEACLKKYYTCDDFKPIVDEIYELLKDN